MSREVKDWFYDVTVIRIDVSGSFAHTSMFEAALQQLAESELSPFRNIRKVELMFVWDTEWIRSEEFARAVFPALLVKRVEHVQQLLQVCATELRQVTVHWHDSINDNESAALKYEVLDHLDALPANIKVEEHYLQPGQKPRAKTIAGKKRLEFQDIADSSYNLS
jgi:MFS superfamily sulfate permease-like transporter